MPFYIALHDGEENLRSVWLITSEDARPEVAGVDEVQEIQANLAVDSEEDWLIEQRGAKTLPPIVLADGTLRAQNWLDRLAREARHCNWQTSYVVGPFETDLTDPAEVLARFQDDSLDLIDVVRSGWDDDQP